MPGLFLCLGVWMPERVQVATNLSGPVRRVMFMGREHIAVPAVLVRSKVLRNNLGVTYLPPDAITPEWADIANGRPAVADHPRTSANSPEVLNKLGIGLLFNTRAEGDALRADVYLDPARAGDVPDLTAILAKLEAGEKVEVSTGFPVSIDETPGAFNGEQYERVIHPVGFDHLAVFAKSIGACSVKDGCGLAANHEGECEQEERVKEVDEETQGRLAAAINKLVNLLGGQSGSEEGDGHDGLDDADNSEGGDPMNREQMIAQLADGGTDKDALAKLSDCQLKALMGAGEAAAANAEGDSLAWQKAKEWRERFEALDAETQTARQAEEKEKTDLLDDLLYNSRELPWSEKEIRAMDIVQLRKVHRAVLPRRTDYSGRGAPAGNAGSFDFVGSIMDGPAGTSVLDRKEAH